MFVVLVYMLYCLFVCNFDRSWN